MKTLITLVLMSFALVTSAQSLTKEDSAALAVLDTAKCTCIDLSEYIVYSKAELRDMIRAINDRISKEESTSKVNQLLLTKVDMLERAIEREGQLVKKQERITKLREHEIAVLESANTGLNQKIIELSELASKKPMGFIRWLERGGIAVVSFFAGRGTVPR